MKKLDTSALKAKRKANTKRDVYIDVKPTANTSTTTTAGILSPLNGGVTEAKLTDVELLALSRKSTNSDIPLEHIYEVYLRGYNQWTENPQEGKTPQQVAFARVNSYIAGGRAYAEDGDLRG